ncbi:unnamed protein product [Danaus chrysippus]|uniref:(African queen) hypothetical protein n=1 Tax=Danaus chrysippus TaxID=151541 RepID=A0A8J2QY00_9NEOP|nr:unnamed protein product [Danaus chrysippus]
MAANAIAVSAVSRARALMAAARARGSRRADCPRHYTTPPSIDHGTSMRAATLVLLVEKAPYDPYHY